MENSKEARVALCERLEAEYRDRFLAIGASAFNAWANARKVGVEAAFGARSGPLWVASVVYARRMRPFGPAVPLTTLQEAAQELRRQIETELNRHR